MGDVKDQAAINHGLHHRAARVGQPVIAIAMQCAASHGFAYGAGVGGGGIAAKFGVGAAQGQSRRERWGKQVRKSECQRKFREKNYCPTRSRELGGYYVNKRCGKSHDFRGIGSDLKSAIDKAMLFQLGRGIFGRQMSLIWIKG